MFSCWDKKKAYVHTYTYIILSDVLNYTYSIPEHEVQTKEPIVILIYVGPLW